jgi:hypothetical protein
MRPGHSPPMMTLHAARDPDVSGISRLPVVVTVAPENVTFATAGKVPHESAIINVKVDASV